MSSDSKTKYVILVPDGMADSPVPELDNRTPLDVADTPWMDRMAAAGKIGLTRTVPEGMSPGSDVANLSIIGFNPAAIYTGRAPLEAASMGIELRETDLAFGPMLELTYAVGDSDNGQWIVSLQPGTLITTGSEESTLFVPLVLGHRWF